MQTPPLTEGGHRRPMSDACDVIIHDTEDGVVLVIENRDKVAYTMRFDFGASENLMMGVADDVDHPDAMKCNIVVEPSTTRNLCELCIEDTETKDSFEMRYRVQCLVKNPKTGELEEVKPPPQRAPEPEGDDGEEERKEITKTLFIIIKDTASGYILFLENLEKVNDYHCVIDMSNSENLAMEVGPGAKASAELVCDFVAKPGKAAFARLSVKERSAGSCALAYKVKQRLDTGNEEAAKKKAEEDARKKAEEEAAKKKAEEEAKKKAEEEAARKKAEEEAAKKKAAEEEAARKKAEEEAAKKKAEEEEAARKKAEEEAARKKAEEEAARKKAEEEAARKKAEEEAARKKREEEEARKKAEEEALRKKAAEAEAARRAAEMERIRLEYEEKFKKLIELEYTIRMRLEVEWKGYWVKIQRQYRESMCNLCRGLLKETHKIVDYTDKRTENSYRLHQQCYDRCPKCDFCGDLLVGGYVVTKGDIGAGTKLHRDCIQGYKESSRPQCAKCGNKIMDEKWSTLSDKQYHAKCAEGL